MYIHDLIQIYRRFYQNKKTHKCGHLDAAYIYDVRCFGW